MENARLAFGPFVLDPVRGVLLRDGKALAVGQRGVAVLQALLAAEGRVVGKAELMERAWPGIFVEESNLTVQVAGLRKALGSGPDGQGWITTVPRVGYRLVRGEAEASPGVPAVAVLPFDNLGGDPGHDWFADGVVEEIITALARFRSFAVVARNSSFAYRGRAVDVRQVAAALGARYVLEGSVRRAGERLRIAAQLVDGETGESVWADRFEGELGDVFEFQDRITEQVATLVEPAIEAAELARSRRERPGSLAAYDIYLRALAYLSDESEASNAAAYALLTEALALEPDDAVMLGHAAWALEHRSTMGWRRLGPDDRERCVELARRGLQHAAGNARVMAQCGIALLQTGKAYDLGTEVLRGAARINPNDLYVLSAAAAGILHCGEIDEAVELAHRVIRLSHGSGEARFGLTLIAMVEIMRGNHAAALDWATRSLAVNAFFDATYWMLIAANAHLGRMLEARRHLGELQRIAPGVTVASIRAGQPAKDPARIAAVLEGLRLAGMPEG